jgi:hypothetical protein
MMRVAARIFHPPAPERRTARSASVGGAMLVRPGCPAPVKPGLQIVPGAA